MWRVLEAMRRQYGLSAIELRRAGAPIVRTGSAAGRRETRTVGSATLILTFKSDLPVELLSTLRIAAVAGALAAITGAILLAMKAGEVVRGTTPMDTSGSAESNGGGTSYLMHTFESSLKTLKTRENELTRLHLQEKDRADEVARLTATLVRSLNSGFLALDEHGRVVDLNQAAYELLGVRSTARVTARELVEALGASPFTRTLADACAGRIALQRQEVSTGGDSPHIIGLTTVPLLDPQGRYLGMFGLFADLTPIRELEERIRELQSLADLGEMSAGIAHEFRNSLSAILGYLKLAQRGRDGDEISERVRNAEREAALLARSVESLLAFARPVTLSSEEIDLLELARSTAERLSAELESIDLQFKGESVSIEGDRSLLGRALENVLRNAIDAVRETHRNDGSIIIETRSSPVPAITVSDNGIGIEEARMARLFLPFQSTKPHGFGLGLALTRKIVLVHGGTIRLEGAPGRGATATLEFANAPLSLMTYQRTQRYLS